MISVCAEVPLPINPLVVSSNLTRGVEKALLYGGLFALPFLSSAVALFGKVRVNTKKARFFSECSRLDPRRTVQKNNLSPVGRSNGFKLLEWVKGS
jgi:hypothetical protein